MTCRECGEETKRIFEVGCPECQPDVLSFNPNLHKSANNPWHKMTYADTMRIKTRKVEADGKIRPSKKWR